jgi:hypothetical protein
MFENLFGILNRMQNPLTKYASLFLFLFLLLGTIYTANNDDKVQTNNTFFYIIFITISYLFVYWYAFTESSSISLNIYFFTACIIAILCTVFFFYSSSASNTTKYITYFMSLFIFFIIAVGFSMIAYIYANYLKSLKGWVGFIVNLIFYVPCLILDFFSYIRQELNMTTNVLFMLFIFEILLILFYFYMPYLISFIVGQNSIPILKESAWLDIYQQIDTAKHLNENDDSTYQDLGYGFSMWIYLNSQTSNTAGNKKELEIFNYGNNRKGNPRITYGNNTLENSEEDNLNIYFTSSQTVPFTTRIQKQKWNYFVFNYTSTGADVFLNGQLNKTVLFSETELPTFSDIDTVSIGEDNGLYGAICNIQYYRTNLTLPQIVNSYNLLMNQNPPTNNL